MTTHSDPSRSREKIGSVLPGLHRSKHAQIEPGNTPKTKMRSTLERPWRVLSINHFVVLPTIRNHRSRTAATHPLLPPHNHHTDSQRSNTPPPPPHPPHAQPSQQHTTGTPPHTRRTHSPPAHLHGKLSSTSTSIHRPFLHSVTQKRPSWT